MDLNDPLRVGAYGTKKDMKQKGMIKEQERINSKRYYPKDKQILYDEWAAMTKHQQEAIQEQQNEANAMKHLSQKNYANHLQGHKNMQDWRNNEARQKERSIDKADLMQKELASKNIEEIQRNVNLNLKQNLVAAYSDAHDQKNLEKNHDRQKTLLEGREMNQQAERLMNAQKIRKDQLRALWQNVKREDLHQKEMKKQMERENRQKDRRDYIRQIEEQQRREVERDLSYRRYYNSVEAKLKNNYESLRRYINPNLVNESTSTAPSQIHSQIVSPDNRSHKDDKFRLKAVPQIPDQTTMYAQYMGQTKEIDRSNREQYKHFLDQQKQWKDFQSKGFGAMTQQERRFNHNDLRYYKKKDAHSEALIPGITTNYQKPGKLGNLFKRMYDPGAYQASPINDGNLRHQSSDPALRQVQKAPVPGHMASHSTLIQQGGSFSTPPNDRITKQVSLSAKSPEPVGYNPISNPVPGINHNPYLRKMANQVGSIAMNPTTLFGGLDGRPVGGSVSPGKANSSKVLNQAGHSILF